MLISALNDYYGSLQKAGKVCPSGYSNVRVSYLISLTPDGVIDDIIDYRKEVTKEEKGKKTIKKIPREILMPLRVEKTAIFSNYLDHRPKYIFGLETDGDTLTSRGQKGEKSHNHYIKMNLEFLEGLNSEPAVAFRKFIEKWNPEEETENEFLTRLGKDADKTNFVFCISGSPGILLHDYPEIRQRFESLINMEKSTEENLVFSQCAIAGKTVPIARIHNSIKRIKDGQPSGTVLVGFNKESFESYGNKQSYNSSISEEVMKRYTEALNYLVSNPNNRTYFDDVTLVHWASNGDEKCDDLINTFLFDTSEKMDADQTERMIRDLLLDSKQGNVTETRLSEEMIDPAVQYYIVGLKPNASRLALKFIYRKSFTEFLKNIARHQVDIRVDGIEKSVPFRKVKEQLTSPKSTSENINPSIMAEMFNAILNNTRYPKALMSTLIRRIRTDSDDSIPHTDKAIRIGLLKACINREDRFLKGKENIKMSLDKENSNQAYLCGRLFAVLEKIQQDAANNSLNRTIKDTYFSAASLKPSSIFPKILRLSQHHLNKVNYPGHYNSMISEIMELMGNKFPDNLLMADQGRFMIGYYQQNKDLYKKKEKTETAPDKTV